MKESNAPAAALPQHREPEQTAGTDWTAHAFLPVAAKISGNG